MDQLMLSVFNMCPEFAEVIQEDLLMRDFILSAFAKVHKVVVSRKESTKKLPYFLKTVWERDMLSALHWTCFTTVRVYVYTYSLWKYVFLINICVLIHKYVFLYLYFTPFEKWVILRLVVFFEIFIIFCMIHF